MSVSDKIKALLTLKGKKSNELAEYFGISAQAMSNKIYRNSFSATDLIKIADFLSCELAFIVNDNQKIIFDKSDVDKDTQKALNTQKVNE